MAYYGEFGTDKFIRERYFPNLSVKGILVEVGAATPEFLSMSKHFLDSGWRCIEIEPNPKFAAMHRSRGNEIYQYAAGGGNADNVDFEVVHFHDQYDSQTVTDHSYSALKVRDDYKAIDPNFSKLNLTTIKVAVRTLDWILATHCPNLGHVNFLSVDVEGWELEVMAGFDLAKYRPDVVLLENFTHKPDYASYMQSRGYFLNARIEYNYLYRRSAPTPQE